MIDETHVWFFAGAVFLLAGLVKGVLGMGLPTVAMGLLALALPPADAAVLLVIPSLVTNVWQLLAGPSFKGLVVRLAGMMAGVVVGTLLSANLLLGATAGIAAVGLGVALLAYAGFGLSGARLSLSSRSERWTSPAVGLATGLVTGATGVFVLPAVPYLQAIGLERDDLVQALGLSFTVSTLALAAGLLRGGTLPLGLAWDSLVMLLPALGGMVVGQVLRRRIAPRTFRTVFFAGLLVLGAYLALRGIA
jgi:uncharacterized membrane protein YfcA